MLWTTWIGAALVICGVLYMAMAALYRARLSKPRSSASAARTLEPQRRGVGFLGLATNWPGLLLAVIGALMLLSGAFIYP